MESTTLATLGWPALRDAFNAVYDGYGVPLTFTAEAVEWHCRAHDIDRDGSPLWRDEAGAVVGLAALGVRGERAWLGGFGVAPAFRGRGLSHEFTRGAIGAARALGLERLQLEVLTNNPAAIRAYERAGFVRRRDLRILARDADAPPARADTGDVRDADPAMLLEQQPRLQRTPPCWQREARSLAAATGLRGLALGAPDAPRAYALYRASDTDIHLADLVAADARDILPLLAALAARFPGRRMRLGNEPEDSGLCEVLEEHGWRETHRQHEMCFDLA